MKAGDPRAPYARLAVVALIREPGEARWLLVRAPLHTPAHLAAEELWAPPGGRLERDESLKEAVVREMREEVGLEVTVFGPCYAYLTMHKGERTLAVSMACRVPVPAPPLTLAPAEVLDARWVITEEWLAMAHDGVALWTAEDIRRATLLAGTLLDLGTGA
ncbi:MAG: NUDIX hydrolase [Actinobacteria bacterium]|nr:NUDIX hydrolase [Actinomycetota bacterium]